MALSFECIVVLSLLTIVDATQITFKKDDAKIFIETDSEHYAAFEPLGDESASIVVVDGNTQYTTSHKCLVDKVELNGADNREAHDFDVESKFSGQGLPELGASTKSYSWTDTISSDQNEYFAVRLDKYTFVYSSKYYPKSLARVIISRDISRGVVIFVHHNGRISMKMNDCLYINEWNLVKGIKNIDVYGTQATFFSPVGDKALKKYLKAHPISEANFDTEQSYIRTEHKGGPWSVDDMLKNNGIYV